MTGFPLAVATILALIAVTSAIARPRRHHTLRYELYLRSPIWRLRRRLWILQAGGRCQDCHRRRRPLTIHHLTYRRLGRERRRDVRVLCWGCHQARHHSRSRHDHAEPLNSQLR